MQKNDYFSQNFKNLTFEEFLNNGFLPLLLKVDDLEQNLKKEQEGFLNFFKKPPKNPKISEKECMLNKICDLEDQIENLNDLTRKLKERVYF